MRISAARKIRQLRPLRENAVRPQMHIVSSIFVVQYLAIARNEHRDRIRQQESSRGDRTGEAIEPLMADSGIFQVHGIHQMVQRNVRVTAAQAGEQRRHQT